MKLFLAIALLCVRLPAMAQSSYTGHTSYSGNSQIAATSCPAPNFCAYTGVDVIPGGTAPNFNSDATGLTNNNATSTDTSYLGHINFDGSTFSNPLLLSPLTRLTDANSTPGLSCTYHQAGLGGSGDQRLVNTNTSLVLLGCTSSQHIGLFNTSGALKGHFTPIGTGVFITTNLNVAGGGSSTQAEDFGSSVFSATDPSLLFISGSDSYDAALLATQVTPVTINYAVNTPLASQPRGAYQIGSSIVDYKYAFPANNAPNWTTATSSPYGAYMIHPLAPAEMWNGTGTWIAGVAVNPGDIIDSGAPAHCMYKAIAGGTTAGTTPAFINTGTSPCRPDQIAESATGGGAVVWKGTNSTPQFLYQNITASCAPCTTGAVSTWLAASGHPDFLDTGCCTDSGSGGFTLMNVGPAFVPTANAQFWQALAGTSGDTGYSGKPSQYGLAASTNCYGNSLVGYAKYNCDQGTGIWHLIADASAGAHGTFHVLNSGTGIWTDAACGSGTLATCGSITTTTVGGLTAIINPLGTGQTCPFLNHNLKLDGVGLSGTITNQVNIYSACNTLQNFLQWRFTASAFCASLTACGGTPGSLQFTFGGLNHWGEGVSNTFTFHGGANGMFSSVYQNSSVSTAPGTGTLLIPLASQATTQTTPPGCYVTVAGVMKSPDCALGEVLDGHPSVIAGDAMPAVSAFFNYATGGPAFNAWQNMILAFPQTPLGCTTAVNGAACNSTNFGAAYVNPTQSFGGPWQFAHTWALVTSTNFDTQFSIGEPSQDDNWFFYSSDWNGTLGSITGSAPAVWSSGTYYRSLLVTAVPASPTSLSGPPWLPSTAYVAGNTFNPIEGTGGAGAIDDVFQVTTSGTTGANSTLTSSQPACLQYMKVGGVWTAATKGSCFAGTNAPSMLLTATGATESGTTGTFTTSPILLNVGVKVTLAGFTWTGGNGNGTFAVTGTVGVDCPGTNCGTVTTFQLAGMPSSLGTATVLGTVAAQGDSVCDSPSDNGSGSVNSFNPASCTGSGVISRDLGIQTQRGDVFAVNLGNQH